MKNLCVLTPAIIDQEVIEVTSKLLYENLFKINKDIHFTHVVQLCNHKRQECVGDIDSIEKIYMQYDKLDNVTVKVNKSHVRLGHVLAGFNAYATFLSATDCDYCLLIEDDIKLNNPLYIDNLTKVVKEHKEKIIHLSAGYDYPGLNKYKGDPGKEDCTSECTIKDKVDEIDKISIFSNTRSFCSWNGNLLSREMVLNILKNSRPWDVNDNCEDQISRMDHYRSFEILTLGHGEGVNLVGNSEDYHIHFNWRLPKESHYLLETIRRARASGRPGFLG